MTGQDLNQDNKNYRAWGLQIHNKDNNPACNSNHNKSYLVFIGRPSLISPVKYSS